MGLMTRSKCEPGCSCYKHSEAHRRKLSAAHKERGTKPPSRKGASAKCSVGCTCGRHFQTDEHRRKNANAHRGRAMTTGAKQKRAVTMAGKEPAANYKDRRSLHPHYSRWYSMVIRCENASHPTYRHYGARGITVCSEWVKDPWSFFNYLDSELGPCPPKYSLDRIDVNGNYEPGNLRWASPQEQAANRRPRRLVKLVQSSSHVWAIRPWADKGVQPIWD